MEDNPTNQFAQVDPLSSCSNVHDERQFMEVGIKEDLVVSLGLYVEVRMTSFQVKRRSVGKKKETKLGSKGS
jgi:hypothetical protein